MTRPIRIECYRDRLVLVPERGLRGGVTIPIRGETRDSVDALAESVRAYIDSWGLAGEAMYWRPLLSVRVSADAEDRFAELKALLDHSGFLVERKAAE